MCVVARFTYSLVRKTVQSRRRMCGDSSAWRYAADDCVAICAGRMTRVSFRDSRKRPGDGNGDSVSERNGGKTIDQAQSTIVPLVAANSPRESPLRKTTAVV